MEQPPVATPTPVTEIPATLPIGSTDSVADYREARDKGLTEIPNPAARPVETPAAVEEPVDPELATEIDTLEPPKADETPQEKGARTKRHKEAARKGIVSRLAKQRDKERDRANTFERELTELRQRHQTPPVAPQGPLQPARAVQPPVYDGSDPNDPEPMLEAFGDQADPYIEWTKARTGWAARHEVRKAQYADRSASRAAQADERRTAALRAFDTYATEIRKTDPGFDAAIEHLELSGPMQAVVFGSGKLGPPLARALANDPAEHARILALSPAEQFLELGALKATVAAAVRERAATPTIPITHAPAPHVPTGGGSGTASTRSPADIDSLEEWRSRKTEILAGRS